MAVAGLVRHRKHQFGRQSTFGTPVAAQNAWPFTGTPSINLNWTDPEVDQGSIMPVVPPIRAGAVDATAGLTANSLNYNMIPLLLSGFFGKDVTTAVTPTGAGTGKTWAYDIDPSVVNQFDWFTYQFGDDVLTDWFQLYDGFIESLDVTCPEGLGALTSAPTFRFGTAEYVGDSDAGVTGTVPTASLSLDLDPPIIYLKDGSLFIASDPDDLDTAQISDALHSCIIRFSGDVDQKRYANGSQTFSFADAVRSTLAIELELTFAKTDDTVGTGSESDAWFSDESVVRYVRLAFESLREAETGVPFSWEFSMPMRYYTRAEGESGGNSTVVLTGHAFFDADDFASGFKSTVVNQLAGADL